MKPEIDVFTDASHGPLGYTGAYVIGTAMPIGVRHDPGCHTIMDAELMTAAAALRNAALLFPAAKLTLHIDLSDIKRILAKARRFAEQDLQTVIDATSARVIPDAQQHKRYRQCHRHARIVAGISRRGVNHPVLKTGWITNGKTKRIRKQDVEGAAILVEVLRNHPLGVNEVRLAQESGLGLNVVHKLLNRMEDQVYKEHPTGSALACDLRTWKWFLRGAG